MSLRFRNYARLATLGFNFARSGVSSSAENPTESLTVLMNKSLCDAKWGLILACRRMRVTMYFQFSQYKLGQVTQQILLALGEMPGQPVQYAKCTQILAIR